MIEHDGIISNISGNKISVKILQQSACSECHVKNACMAADTKEKIVEIFDCSENLKLNDQVIIQGAETMGYKAVLWAFVIPVIVLVCVLVVTTMVYKLNEINAAVISLLSLLPYYLILYFRRDKMAKSFKFTIKTNS